MGRKQTTYQGGLMKCARAPALKGVAVSAALMILLATPLALQAEGLSRADQWWGDIRVIASDANEGREPGSAGYLRAADYVEQRFRAVGLQPVGAAHEFRQQVALERQSVDQRASSAELAGPDGLASRVRLGTDWIVGAWGGPRPRSLDAALVFAGYGLHLPERGYDDFAGLDLRGKVVLVIGGGPADIPGPIKANARKLRARLLGEAGAVGLITLVPPNLIEIPWERQKLLGQQSELYLSNASLRDMPDSFFIASVDPAASERLFAGTGHRFAELAALSDASARMPTFTLPLRLKATLVVKRRRLRSPNLVARLEGSDPLLRSEHVVVSAHLDHLGIGAAINGDAIYNGALDDGSGVATVLDLAERLSRGARPKRSVLFLIVTGEESGLLGSTWFARHPTVPRSSLVADLNFDTLLPLWPLTSVLAQGDGESSLGDLARVVAVRQGLTLVPDPLPNRNSFVRTDQYSFIRAGVPALALKFGFVADTEAFRLEHDWRATRYHAPGDDVDQPGVMPAEAIRLDDYAVALTLEIANATSRPAWRAGSIFGKERAE